MTDSAPPLYETPASRAPAGGAAMWLRASDGIRLRAAHWPREAARGTVLLFQGRTEFIEKYYEPVTHFGELGFHVFAFDWRGQGLSDRLLADRRSGYVSSFADYQTDVDAALAELRRLNPPSPWLLVSHSMGGAVAARCLMRQEAGAFAAPGPTDAPPVGPFAAAVFSAPMFGLSGRGGGMMARIAASAMTALGGGRRYVPGGTPAPLSEAGFPHNPLTSDAARFARRYADMLTAHPDLALGGPTWGWLDAARREQRALRATNFPRLVAIGDEEDVVSVDAARRFAHEGGQGRFLLLKGARHEPFLEKDHIQETFWTAMRSFADAHAPRRAAVTPS